jgi:hypothetical protein
MTAIDTVALAHRLEVLMAEYRATDERMGQIRQEARDICSELDSHFKPLVKQNSISHRTRPLDDRLAISLGRTVSKALRLGWDREKTTQEALKKATTIAQKNALPELPEDFVSKVASSVSSRFV